jgi:hypothetical protein
MEDRKPELPGVAEKLAEVGVLIPLGELGLYPRYWAGGVCGGSMPRLGLVILSLAIKSGGGRLFPSVMTL